MSATNSTANYGLPIFLGSDVPSWLTDWNGAMGDIDTAIAAAKAVADSALLASGNNTSDITTIQGQITTLQTTVGTHTTQIGTISGNINTINSLIGNGTPTTTDQTIIGAINELHANQGDLNDLTTTDKSSLVAAINEAAQGGGGGTETVRYYNGYIQYSTDNGVTWINLINVSTPVQLLPLMTSNTSAVGNVTTDGTIGGTAYKAIDGSGDHATAPSVESQDGYIEFEFATAQYVKYISGVVYIPGGSQSVSRFEYSTDGVTWIAGTDLTIDVGDTTEHTLVENINGVIKAFRFKRTSAAADTHVYNIEAFN